MDVLWANPPKCPDSDAAVKPGKTDTYVQLVLSLALGSTAFLAFCLLRPRWKTLYAARRRRVDSRVSLPVLPDSFLGWIPALYRITDEQVLALAGLDAFVFLSFFKLAMKIFAVLFFFAAVVLEPINSRFSIDVVGDDKRIDSGTWGFLDGSDEDDPDNSFNYDMGYLWAYLVFTYVFSSLTLFLMARETNKVLQIRQDYLGTQSTITDRTFKLSGMPKELRTEANIKSLIEQLEIGHVESVTVCCNWKELDDLVDERAATLAKLEESWAVCLAQKPVIPSHVQSGTPSDDGLQETGRLLGASSRSSLAERPRPQTRVWYGFLRLHSRKTDAIDYFEERLRQIDERVRTLRKKEFPAIDQAFVTMDSIAACQMAIQAVIDPRPGQLLTKLAPAPSDVVWRNAYATRSSRRIRSVLVTVFIIVLSIVWLIPVAGIATVFSLCTIRRLAPDLANSLTRHDIVKALFQTGLPTLIVSLLNIAVPYLYDFLSNQQGMLSQGDVELSIISKNFFFTFFNIFLVVTVFGSVTQIIPELRESLSDTTHIARRLAKSIQTLRVFYQNFIMLQGIGLFPFRLLEFGSVSMYPVSKMGAKTPRDYAQLDVPPVFSFGFYLPTALLVFILCLVYSVLQGGYLVLLVGLAYFGLGFFTYKYQLLYAMDQPRHATGGAWRIICYRIVLGLAVFQITMAGYLVLQQAFLLSVLVVPLLVGTLYYSFHWKRRFEPLTNFIALRSIRRAEAAGDDDAGNAILDEDFSASGRIPHELLRRGSTIDEDREKGLRFVNPSLVIPLEAPWIYKEQPSVSASGSSSHEDETDSDNHLPSERRESPGTHGTNSSSLSLGDTHVWRDNAQAV